MWEKSIIALLFIAGVDIKFFISGGLLGIIGIIIVIVGYNSYNNIDAVIQALQANDIVYAVIPKTLYINDIFANNKWIILNVTTKYGTIYINFREKGSNEEIF